MLNKINPIRFVSLTLVFLMAFLSSCESWTRNPLEDKDSGESVKLLIVDFNFIKTRLAFHIKEMNSGEYLDNEEVEVRFLGEGADQLITFAGEKPEKFMTSTGFLQVGVDPNFPLSKDSPLQLSVVVIGENYISAPMALSYTTTGLKDVVVQVVRSGEPLLLKAAFDEPYDLLYNNTLESADLQFLSGISAMETGTDYDYLNLYLTLGDGRLTAENLSEPLLFSDYGVYYIENENALVPPSAPTRDVNLLAGTYVYSSVLRSGIEKCDDGLTISLSSSNGIAGTGSFNYLITYADGSTDSGIISGTLPFSVLIDNIYYPSSNDAVKVEVFGDAQYQFSGAVNLATACGSTAEFTATAVDGLEPYKWVIRYSCMDLAASFALSIGGEFRISGSEDAWTKFQFVEGIAILQLKPDEQYHFRINIDSDRYEYELPTNPEELEQFLLDNQSQDFYIIKTLTITQGSEMVIIDSDVELSGEVCDIIN